MPDLLEQLAEQAAARVAEVVAKLSQEFGFKNVHQVPRLEKVVVNMGVGKATQNAKLIEKARNA